MEIGLFVPAASPFATPEYLTALGKEAEARGYESIWLGEHVVLFDEYESRYPYSPDGRIPAPPDVGLLEPFAALSFLAAITERIRLATGICLVPQRNPVYTAKQVADVDWLSGGRFEFGIGVGWLEEEFRALQVPWERRGARTDEYLDLLTALWTQDVPEHKGEFWELAPCRMYPKPVQEPHPRIHVGGESDAALRRVARAGQGWYGFNLLPADVPERLETLDRFLAEHGRSRADIQVTVGSYFHGLTPESTAEYAAAGVDRVVANLFALEPGQIAESLDELDPCLETARATV